MEPRSGRSILVTGVYMLYFDTTRRRLVFTRRTVLSIFFVAVQSCQDDRDQQSCWLRRRHEWPVLIIRPGSSRVFGKHLKPHPRGCVLVGRRIWPAISFLNNRSASYELSLCNRCWPFIPYLPHAVGLTTQLHDHISVRGTRHSDHCRT